ncbi:MAG: NusG domain II-containing protein [Christensenella sp.]
MKKLISKTDIIFTVAIAAAVLLIWFFTLPRAAGQAVVFRQNGEIVAQAPLFTDADYTFDGQYHNVFTIKNGTVKISETNCPNHQCQKTGVISRAGQSIVCAPNGVSATITGTEGVDGVTG